MKIWLPNNSRPQIGGGFSFFRTFKKYCEFKITGLEIVDSWRDADVGLISGITLVDLGEVAEASRVGLPIVFRVDNVPRKSRNRRNTPHERMSEVAKLSSAVIYQSNWAMNYCFPLCGEGTVIYNGVDTDIFSPAKIKPDVERWLFAYHGKNEMKEFWTAHLLFQLRARKNPLAEFWFVNDFGRDEEELVAANYDFWNGEKIRRIDKPETPEEMADLMRQCSHLVHPAVGDACPQTVLEARACGLEIVGAASERLSGTRELLNPSLDVSALRMVIEYLSVFKLIHSDTCIG